MEDKKNPKKIKKEKSAKVEVAKVQTEKKIIRKKFSGVVVSDIMDKTVVVRMDRVKIHPKYKKRYTTSKKYKVHDEKNKFKIDDKVEFIECRPMSKDKRWRVLYN